MANIVLTNKCNLKCSYCFAKKLTDNKSLLSFSEENFIKAVDFIKTGKITCFGIVGGEPAIHPDFAKFLEIINKDNQINNCTIYTNGIEIYKYIDILQSSKFGVLINCNAPDDIGNLYIKLENTVKLLAKIEKKEFNLGINIYSETMDYSYIFDLLKIAKKHELRFSISISNNDKQNCSNILDLLKQFNPVILNFYNDCIKNEIVPYFDCSSIPMCIIDEKLITAQLKINELKKKYNVNRSIIGNPCSLKVDILPDLTAVRSICYPYYKKAQITDFKTINQLIKFFDNEVDVYHKLIFASEKCKTCKYRLIGQCNICPCFMMDKFQNLKNYVLNTK